MAPKEPKDNMRRITENTMIPVSFLFVLLGLAAWVGTIKANVATNADDIKRVEKLQEEYTNVMRSIDERLSRIEGAIQNQPAHP